jgi:hypothetical protein
MIKSSASIKGIQLIDLLGQVVWTQQTSRQDWLELTLPKVPNGQYLMKVETSQGIASRRIQIQH